MSLERQQQFWDDWQRSRRWSESSRPEGRTPTAHTDSPTDIAVEEEFEGTPPLRTEGSSQ